MQKKGVAQLVEHWQVHQVFTDFDLIPGQGPYVYLTKTPQYSKLKYITSYLVLSVTYGTS